jgi:hypothetical protein
MYLAALGSFRILAERQPMLARKRFVIQPMFAPAGQHADIRRAYAMGKIGERTCETFVTGRLAAS